MLQARTPQESDTQITELMIPSYANFGGKIHGGTLLSLMDKAAYACATKHAGNYCVTVTVDGVEFHEPVEVGELVHLMARVNYVGNSSLVVGIKVVTENVKTRSMKHTNTCYFTMVAKNDHGKPTKVPALKLTSPKDAQRFAEALIRKEAKTGQKKEMQAIKESYSEKQFLEIAKGHRFELGF